MQQPRHMPSDTSTALKRARSALEFAMLTFYDSRNQLSPQSQAHLRRILALLADDAKARIVQVIVPRTMGDVMRMASNCDRLVLEGVQEFTFQLDELVAAFSSFDFVKGHIIETGDQALLFMQRDESHDLPFGITPLRELVIFQKLPQSVSLPVQLHCVR